MPRRTRLEAFALLVLVAAAVGFYLGERHASPPGCDDAGECSLGAEFGLMWAAAAVLASAMLAVTIELVLTAARRRARVPGTRAPDSR